MRVVTYETDDPLRENERFIAWLTEERAIVDKDRKRTGQTKTVFLPVYFFGESHIAATQRASAFWNDERAKKAAKSDRAHNRGAAVISARESHALKAWEETDCDYSYLSFKGVAKRSKLPLKHVRRTVRSLARKGLTVYGKGLWNDDGEPFGAGYAITKTGQEALNAILEAKKSKRQKAWDKAFEARLQLLKATESPPTPTQAGEMT